MLNAYSYYRQAAEGNLDKNNKMKIINNLTIKMLGETEKG